MIRTARITTNTWHEFLDDCVDDTDLVPRIKDKRNLMITGSCGGGKKWLACALAQSACRDGITVLYKRMPCLFGDKGLAHGDGRFPRVFKALTKSNC